MKKLLVMLVSVILLLSSCDNTQIESTIESSDDENKIVKSALALIDEGKNHEAYKLLYDNRSDEEAKKMLDDFTVVYTSATGRGYYTYGITFIEEYNEHGDVTRSISKGIYEGYDYTIDYSYEYTYNEDGFVLTCTRTEEGENTPVEVTNYTYDERNNLLKEEKVLFPLIENETTSYIEYKYDENDNLIYEALVHPENNLAYYYRYAYDEKGRLVTQTYYNTEKNNYVIEYTYNEDDIVIKEVETLDSSVTTIDYTINEHGDVVKKTYSNDYIPNKSPYEEHYYSYTYDDAGRITKKVTDWPNGETTVDEYVFNEQGDVIKETHTNTQGINSITENEYVYENGKISKKTTTRNECHESTANYKYDSYGSKIHEESKNVSRDYEYTYDELGRVVTMVQDFDTKRMFEYTYDENNNEIKRVVYAVGTPDIKNTTEQVFDENGKVIKITESLENGSYVYVTTHTYDERGNILTRYKVRENSEAETDQVYTYVYDDNGNILEKTIASRRTEGKNKYVFEYDENGNRIKEELYHEDDKLFITTEHTYDSENRVVKTVIEYAEEKKLPTIYEYEYDECGNLIYEFRLNEQYSGNNVATSYTYSNYEYYYTPNKPKDK